MQLDEDFDKISEEKRAELLKMATQAVHKVKNEQEGLHQQNIEGLKKKLNTLNLPDIPELK